MRFIMVNDRTPRPQSFCASCDQSIGARYLREIGTHLIYCDHNCYADHCKGAALLLENLAMASLPSVRHAHAQEGINDALC